MKILNNKQAKIISLMLMAFSLLFIFHLNLFSFLFSIILIHSVIKHLSVVIEKYITDKRARFYSTIVISIITAAIFALIFVLLIMSLTRGFNDVGELKMYFEKLIYETYDFIEIWTPNGLSFSKEEAFHMLIEWVKDNSSLLKSIGTNTLNIIVNVFIGLIIGILIALIKPNYHNKTIFKKECLLRLHTLSQAFSNIVFAQVKISIINTVFTSIYILIILPILNIHLPYMKTLILLTFIFGLLPIIGNIISNTLICIASFAISPILLICSLVFLVVIHKAEYFLNAKIIGGHINAKAYELLIAMILFKAMFGLAGLIAAPIYYAYFKKECKRIRLF